MSQLESQFVSSSEPVVYEPRRHHHSSTGHQRQCHHRHHHHHHHHCHHHRHPHLGHRSSRISSKSKRTTPSRSASQSQTRKKTRKWKKLSSISAESQSTRPISQPSERSVMDRETRCSQLCSKLRQLLQETQNLTEPSDASDVIVRTSHGETFYCHSFVIEMWAPHLLTSNKLDDEYGYEMYVDGYSNGVVEACLRIIYGGTIEADSAEFLEDVMNLADSYQIPDLKGACLKSAADVPLTVDNACSLLLFAKTHNLTALQQKAMLLVIADMENISTTDQWRRMAVYPELLIDLFYAISEWTKPIDGQLPSGHDSRFDHLWNESNGLRIPVGHSDMKIETKDGTTFHVHLSLLTLSAPIFAGWLYEVGSDKPGNTVEMTDFDADVVEEFLRCLYYQDPTDRFPELADQVYALAVEYNADTVTRLCGRQIAQNQLVSIEHAIGLLEDAEYHRMPTAMSMCFQYLCERVPELKQHKGWKKFVKQNPEMIRDLIAEWEEYRQWKGSVARR